MGNFFSMDGIFYKVGNILADIMILGILWLLCSIPIITMGASTTAVFYVMTRRISNREGYLIRDFFKSFKSNFKQSTLVHIGVMFVLAILAINILNINLLGSIKNIILPFQICFVFEITIITAYIYPLIARFQMNTRTLVKTAFFMANKHIFTSIFTVVLGFAAFLLIFTYPPFLLIAFGAYAYSASHFLMRVFKKYRPEIDKDEYADDAFSIK